MPTTPMPEPMPEPPTSAPARINEHYALGGLVTVAAFRTFVDAGGYDEPRHWSRAGWRWRKKERIGAPRFWGESEWAAFLEPDHPVVGVSAYEAEAFAEFCAAGRARLPSESEWSLACGGTRGQKYPWGDDWLDGACGHRACGQRCTLAVHGRPLGRSTHCGLDDLCGNVWQWTSDERRGQRVVCGGAWNNLAADIGCAARNGYPPEARFSNIGFRMAWDLGVE